MNDGEIVTVVGANGAGKSTILKNVSRLVRPTSGSITFDDADLGKLQSHEVVEHRVIQVPEGRRIFPEMTVVENLRMGSFVKSTRPDRERNMDRVFSLFPRLGERKGQLGGTMSGGEQQMLAIARGLMANPKLLLLDEPSLGLSPLLVKNIFEIIKEINAQGTTILLVEQNVYQSLHISTPGLRPGDGAGGTLGERSGAPGQRPRQEGLPGDVTMANRLTVADWMTKNPITIEEDASVIEAIHLLKEKNIRRLPVMKRGRLAGLVTEKMLFGYMPAKASSLDQWELHYLLSKTPVRSAMNPKPHTVTPETSIAEAAKLIHDRKLNGIIVVNENQDLVGLLTTTNALEALIWFTQLAAKLD